MSNETFIRVLIDKLKTFNVWISLHISHAIEKKKKKKTEQFRNKFIKLI